MPTTVGSAQVRLAPSLTGFAQRLRSELRTVRTDDLTVGIDPKLNRTAANKVTRDLDKLTRARSVAIFASVDTRVAAEEIAALTRNRTATVRVDADTRVAADEINVLTRERTLTIRTRTVGGTGGGPSPVGGTGSGAGAAGALLSLAPAVAPVAAYLASTLASVAAAGGAALVSVGAFGAALKPQLAMLTGLAAAESTASAAVKKYGAASKEAHQAQDTVAETLDAMPGQTQRAALGFSILKDDFKKWSDDMSDFTMVPVTQGLAIADSLIPRFSTLVKDSSGQLTRLTTIAAGAVETPGFDKMISKFDTFSAGALKQIVDETVHLTRLLSEGKTSGPASEFLAYAKQNGPEVRETLTAIATDVLHVVQGVSEAGPSMLTVVDAAAHLVSALPPEFIGRALQLYSAFRLYKLTAGGINTVAGSLRTVGTRLTAVRTASTAAGGGLAGVRTAIASLSTGAKIGGALLAVTAVVVLLDKLSSSGKKAPDVDKMTTAIGQLGRTGKVTGEASRVFGKDFDDLNTSIGRLNGQRSGMDAFNDSMNRVFTLGMAKSNSAKKAAKDVDAVDKSLADLVKNGQPDLAVSALKRLTSEYTKSGKPASDLTSKLDDYQSALSDAKFEQDLTADSMGLFGRQSQQVQAQLDDQKKSADGLRQSIQALNDVNRAGLNAESDFEQAIDDASGAIKHHETALKMVNGQLDLNSQKARDAYKPLSDLADKTDAAAAALRDQGKSWDQVEGVYDRGRAKLIATAQAMGLQKSQATALANEILKAPDKTAYLKGNIDDLKQKVTQAQSRLKSVPPSKTTAIKGNIAQLNNEIRDAQAKIDSLHGGTVTIRATYAVVKGKPTEVFHEGGGYATGGVLPGHTPGRDVHHFYSPTAGSLHLSGGEAVMHPEWTRAVGPAMVHAWNALSRSQGAAAVRRAMGFKDGGIIGGSYASGGVTGSKAKPLPQNVIIIGGQKVNEGSIANAISNAFASNLAGTVSQIQSATNRVVSSIQSAFKNVRTTLDDRVIAALERQSTQLQNLAKKRDGIKAQLAAASSYAVSARDSAQSFASMTSLPAAGGSFGAGGILAGLQTRLGQIKKFTANIALLGKRGLSKTLLNQLVQAGPEQGSAYAQALADASASTLKSINSTQSAIDKAATAYGRGVADTMYDSGSQAGKGFLTGLQSQESAIEKEMTTLAKKIQAEIRKELKIHSPSKVTQQLGEFTGQGFLVGFRSKHPQIEASARRMAALVAAVRPGSASIERDQAQRGVAQTVNHFDLHTSDQPTEQGVLTALQRAAVLRRPALLPGG
ncbi:hypothetical protein V2S66_03305 [Streptomyces sp. V4-01]|uniref:Uncharacterized protein n=1 Tax=Actinacidiphila polyblastidii TaxID=3110430 RepID=A0ABU7P599_9ACTN|nr:hypothetical protein [Streptomyces sp. V4-01]